MAQPTPEEQQQEGRIRLTCDLTKSLHRRLKQAALDDDKSLSPQRLTSLPALLQAFFSGSCPY